MVLPEEVYYIVIEFVGVGEILGDKNDCFSALSECIDGMSANVENCFIKLISVHVGETSNNKKLLFSIQRSYYFRYIKSCLGKEVSKELLNTCNEECFLMFNAVIKDLLGIDDVKIFLVSRNMEITSFSAICSKLILDENDLIKALDKDDEEKVLDKNDENLVKKKDDNKNILKKLIDLNKRRFIHKIINKNSLL